MFAQKIYIHWRIQIIIKKKVGFKIYLRDDAIAKFITNYIKNNLVKEMEEKNETFIMFVLMNHQNSSITKDL